MSTFTYLKSTAQLVAEKLTAESGILVTADQYKMWKSFIFDTEGQRQYAKAVRDFDAVVRKVLPPYLYDNGMANKIPHKILQGRLGLPVKRKTANFIEKLLLSDGADTAQQHQATKVDSPIAVQTDVSEAPKVGIDVRLYQHAGEIATQVSNRTGRYVSAADFIAWVEYLKASETKTHADGVIRFSSAVHEILIGIADKTVIRHKEEQLQILLFELGMTWVLNPALREIAPEKEVVPENDKANENAEADQIDPLYQHASNIASQISNRTGKYVSDFQFMEWVEYLKAPGRIPLTDRIARCSSAVKQLLKHCLTKDVYDRTKDSGTQLPALLSILGVFHAPSSAVTTGENQKTVVSKDDMGIFLINLGQFFRFDYRSGFDADLSALPYLGSNSRRLIAARIERDSTFTFEQALKLVNDGIRILRS